MDGAARKDPGEKRPLPRTTLRSEAVRLAQLGYRIIPCHPNKKQPATLHGVKDATSNISSVLTAWNDVENRNIGLATEGMIVVDVDDAAHVWLKDEAKFGLDAAPCQRTPRGGRHYVFRQPPGVAVGCSVKKISPGVDVRANGGYVVVYPSTTPDGGYEWVRPLECKPESVPFAPGWLLDLVKRDGKPDQRAEPTAGEKPVVRHSEPDEPPKPPRDVLERARRYVAAIPPAISGQAGHDQTFIAACSLVLGFNLSPDEALPIIREWNATCQPPWTEKELLHKLDDANAKPDRRGYLLDDQRPPAAPSPQSPADPVTGATPRPRFEMRVMSCANLAAGSWTAEYYIDGILAVGQPAIIAGAQKTLKTSIVADLMLSVATFTPFLGHYAVSRAARCMFVTGESGMAAIQETMLRICATKGISLRDVTGLHVCDDLPRFDNAAHVTELQQKLGDYEIELVAIDPAYLAMPGDKAENFFVQGERLRAVSEACQERGATLLLVHHISKGRASYEPPELADMAWSGFGEFARQWMLIGRREKYEPGTGQHQLWLSAGGSLGHNTLAAVDIAEGLRTDPGGRRWDVSLCSASEQREQQRTARATKQAENAQRQAADDERRLIEALRRVPAGETKSVIRDVTGLNTVRAAAALGSLMGKGKVAQVVLTKSNKPYDGYKLTGK
jgi:hypothetical protein